MQNRRDVVVSVQNVSYLTVYLRAYYGILCGTICRSRTGC
jgi:hypothetical protein